MIKEEDGKYYVYNRTGEKRLSKGYGSKEEADKRLGQIEYFKTQDSEEEILLNEPFETPDGPKSHAMYTKNKVGDIVLMHYDEKPPLVFRDAAFYDQETKRVFSARDGIQEYYGHEFGHPESNRKFKIIRKADELAAMSSALRDIPISNEHVEMDGPVPDEKLLGRINNTEIVEDVQPDLGSTMALQNSVDFNEEGQRVKGLGKKYFSLAYNAELRPYDGDEADLEQYNFIPHHLALVDNPRGGENLTFKDGKMENIFKDANGDFTLSAVTQMAEELPALMQDMPVDDLKKVKTLFDKLKGDVDAELKEEAPEAEVVDEEAKKSEEEIMDEEAKTEEEAKEEKPFTDSKEFFDAVDARASELATEKMEVIDKARDFLPIDYNFSDSSTDKIMEDAVKTEYPGESFKDSELRTAFKMMRKPENKDFSKFVDSSKHFDTAKIGDMEI